MIHCNRCNHDFALTPETFCCQQLFFDHRTGAVWLYLLTYNCPNVLPNGEKCASSRCIVMFEDVEDIESERAEAAE